MHSFLVILIAVHNKGLPRMVWLDMLDLTCSWRACTVPSQHCHFIIVIIMINIMINITNSCYSIIFCLLLRSVMKLSNQSFDPQALSQ